MVHLVVRFISTMCQPISKIKHRKASLCHFKMSLMFVKFLSHRLCDLIWLYCLSALNNVLAFSHKVIAFRQPYVNNLAAIGSLLSGILKWHPWLFRSAVQQQKWQYSKLDQTHWLLYYSLTAVSFLGIVEDYVISFSDKKGSACPLKSH